MLELHGSQRPRDRKPPALAIAEVRDMLLLDTDKQTLAWLRPFNPLLCITPQGEAALLLTRDTVPYSGTNNPAVQSLYILEKAQGAIPLFEIRKVREHAMPGVPWQPTKLDLLQCTEHLDSRLPPCRSQHPRGGAVAASLGFQGRR